MQKRALRTDDIPALIVIAAILFGGWFRIMPAWLAGFPVNDGGMFYTMILDLQANRYLPPLFTTYNQASIPFAYPPLGFYVGAALSDLLHISPILVIQWLPAAIHTMCIPALYFMARELTEDKLTSAIASFSFAFTPHLNTWLSAGGGLTRSFGTLFLILTILFSHQLLIKNDSRAIGLTILAGSFTVLSHTESTAFAIGIPIYIWLSKLRSVKGVIQGGWVALGVLLLAGPWYGLIIHRHGIATLLSAIQTGGQSLWAFAKLINLDMVTEEQYLDLVGVFGVLGLAVMVIKKRYFIPVMLLVIYIIQPRSAHTVGNIPLALAAGVFISEALLPVLSKFDETNRTRSVNIFLLFLAPYLLVNSVYNGITLSQNHVSEGERTAMQWVKENTPSDSHFLVITGESDAMCDSESEWFPALTSRKSLTTPQGREWLEGGHFSKTYELHASLQRCIDENLDCLEGIAGLPPGSFNYAYIAIAPSTQNCKASESFSRASRGLAAAMENAEEYSVAYRTEAVVIFEKK